MSLVERALKKLQESRSGAPGTNQLSTLAHSAMPATPVRPMSTSSHAGARSDERSALAREMPDRPELPSRRVVIDRAALRAMELLPPADLERQIASQYQQVKRPLIASALGKTGNSPRNGHAIMLASALPGEGKTFTSINLALSIALEKDTEILLVDADVAKPHLTKIFGLQAERGLLDLLTDSSIHPESVILPTDVPGLSILPAGRQTDTATELLASKRMEHVVAQLAGVKGHRIVLFDSPPLLLSTESRALVPSVGQVVLVVRAEATPQRAVQEAIEAIGDGKPVSLILNQTSTPAASGYYGYGTYGDAEPKAAS
jgi:protein-tyrosine kinase